MIGSKNFEVKIERKYQNILILVLKNFSYNFVQQMKRWSIFESKRG